MSATADRTAGLRATRAKDSADKRARTREAIEALEAAGNPVTAAAVANAVGVSTWLVYTAGLREHLNAARRRQQRRSAAPDETTSKNASTAPQRPATPNAASPNSKTTSAPPGKACAG